MSAELTVSSSGHRWRIRDRHTAGELVRLRRGLYTPVDSGASRVLAATVRLGAVASHETAAGLWGLPTLGGPDTIHVTRPRRSQGTARYEGVTVHHAGLPPDHVTVRHGIPVTTVTRTVVDLARNRRFRAGVVTADAALRTGRCDRTGLLAAVGECRRWPGVGCARKVVEFADHGAASPLESISRVAFHDFGLPRPVLQAVVGGFDEVDFLWSDFRVIGEADGLSKYTGPEVLRREKLREEGLAQLGFTVFRWTWADAYHRPDALAHRAMVILTRHGYRP